MNEYFEQEINRLMREMTQLKTSVSKSAGVVPTVSKSASLTIPLSLNTTQTMCEGYTRYRIRPEKDALIMPTLDWYYENVMDNDHLPYTSRAAKITFAKYTNGEYIVQIYARGNTNDTITIRDGGSVNINVVLSVRCTDNFTMEVA